MVIDVDFSAWIEVARRWQTLIASCIAVGAAIVAWINTSRTLRANKKLEIKRRSQKQAALRATLPLTLSEISSYCSLTVQELQVLMDECVNGALPKDVAINPSFPSMPGETVKAFAEFIEYSDDLDTSLFRNLLARLQIHRARIRDVELTIAAKNLDTLILEVNLEEYILDAASIYAAASAAFDYGRGKSSDLSPDITWEQVRSALRNMKVWEFDFERLYDTVTHRETDGMPP